jgi:hypothetical protein
MAMQFYTDNPLIDLVWRRALSGLARSVVTLASRRVLTVGPGYPGIWLEHATLEGLLYADVDPAVAVANHTIFMDEQKPDGQVPYCHLIENHLENNASRGDSSPIGFGQVQSVVSLTLTGYELAQRTGDLAFAARLYESSERWDAWFDRYRDSEKLGLVQAFCVYDTGHDNSWRFGRPPHAVPNHCPERDARRCNEGHDLPWYAPDMSAGRVELRQGLAGLAGMLGRTSDAERWERAAAHSRQSLVAHLYDAEDAFFYDRDSSGRLRRLRTEAAFHPLRVGALSQGEFERMWARHISNPAQFWTHTPFPSVAVDDPAFDSALPPNCWSGASQALTVERAPRWMERYGKYAALAHLLAHWRELLANAEEFRQEANPFTGKLHPDTTPNYAGSQFIVLEAINRLHGIHRYPDRYPDRQNSNELAWNCRMPPGATRCDYRLEAPDVGSARLIQDSGTATLILNDRQLATVSGVCRVRTDHRGSLIALDGTAAETVTVIVNGRAVSVAADSTQRL